MKTVGHVVCLVMILTGKDRREGETERAFTACVKSETNACFCIVHFINILK